MLPIIIVEFNSYNRTIQYIKDFLIKVQSSLKPVFIIVDNSTDDKNYSMLQNEILRLFFIEDAAYDKLIINKSALSPYVSSLNFYACEYDHQDFKVVLCRSNKNFGYGTSNNIGVKLSRFLFPDVKYAILSNNDILFDEELNADELIDCFSNPALSLVGTKVLGVNGEPQSPCRYVSVYYRWILYSLLWPLNKFIPKMDFNQDNILCSDKCFPYRIIGAFLLLDINKFMEVGMFDEQIFLYAEELVLAEKMKSAGYKTYCDCKKYIIHENGVSVKKVMSSMEKLRRQFDSEIYFYSKYKKVNKFNVTIAKVSFKIFETKRTAAMFLYKFVKR